MACRLIAVHDVSDLVQMRIDVVRDFAEVDPFLEEFRRFVSRPQEIATLPLDVIDDPFPIQAPVQADRNESRLARHETGPLGHQCQRFVLLPRFGLDDRNLSYRLIVGLDVYSDLA